ncbi:hypothetical protein FSOLCH5_011537 [Fusarium solani]
MDIKPLPPAAVNAIDQVAAWVRSPAAQFEAVNDVIKVCKNINGLVEVCQVLLKQFSVEVKSVPIENRVSAIQFHDPATVPVDKDWVVDLIPVHIDTAAEGTVTVSSQPLRIGEYAHLKEEAPVTGDFFAVLLLSKFDT